jgi:hypothetical protein
LKNWWRKKGRKFCGMLKHVGSTCLVQQKSDDSVYAIIGKDG